MKRILILTLLFLSLASLALATIKLETETWFDANTVMTTNSDTLLNPGGQFFIGRAYFTLSGDLGTDFYGDPIKERFTLDFSSPTTPIKYAYFDFDLLRTFYTTMDGDQTNTVKLQSVVFSAGLMPVYFGNLSFWSYPLPIKDASELYSPVNYNYGLAGLGKNGAGIFGYGSSTNYAYGIKPTASADFGIMLSGKFLPIEGLTSSFISYYIQMLNGGGYKNGIDNNNGAPFINGATNENNYAYQGSLFLSPLDGTLIGGTYRYVQYDATENFNTESSYAIILNAKNVLNIPIDLSIEYVDEYVTNTAYSFQPASATSYNGFTNDFNGVVYSITLGYGFADWTIEPLIRYDYFSPNTITTNGGDVSSSILYVGASIKLDANNLTMKPLFGYFLTENGAPGVNWIVWLEFAYKLNFTIWQ